MKRIIVILLVWMTSHHLHWAQPINQKDSKGLKQGEWIEYYDQAKTQIKSKGVYKNNKRVGVWFFYYETGEVFLEVEYLTDGITTNLKMYDPDKTKTAEGIYVKGKKEGIWYYYGKDSVKLREEPYKNGLLDGIVKTFYRSGKTFEIITYLKGKREGPWKQFYESGVLKTDGTFKNDTLDGKITYYHSNSKKLMEGTYAKGLRQGVFTIYEDNGKVKETLRYDKGFLHPDDEKRHLVKEPKEVFPESIIYKGGFEGLMPK
ncbi:MAG: toxin-antitoxin system YwqK family antitoxin [Flavobacteriales bacterium]|nr:toxin-antitoxin system YwqK family antitoxin [Flavobacteriales bacterium]